MVWRPAKVFILHSGHPDVCTADNNNNNNSLDRNGLLTDEQKRSKKGSRGTKDQLLIDKAVLKNCWRRLTSLSIAWIG